MFGIGFSELAILAIVAIVLIKPDDLPAFFRKMGKIYGQIRRGYKEVVSVKDDFIREMDVQAAVKESQDQKDPGPSLRPSPGETPSAPGQTPKEGAPNHPYQAPDPDSPDFPKPDPSEPID